MSPSPQKDADVEQEAPTPENSELMDRGDAEGSKDLAYNDFDVKEQDRWLPIANGWLLSAPSSVLSFPIPRDPSHTHGHDSAAMALLEIGWRSVYPIGVLLTLPLYLGRRTQCHCPASSLLP